MKRLLVGTADVALGLTFAAPAHATLQLGVAGHFKGMSLGTAQIRKRMFLPRLPMKLRRFVISTFCATPKFTLRVKPPWTTA